MQKRSLTPSEIKSICNQIVGFKDLPVAIANSVISNLKKQIKEQLQGSEGLSKYYPFYNKRGEKTILFDISGSG